VSEQPQALERSTLEGKDRTELMTIAKAMGAKPGSRSRKAEIIDLIIATALGPDTSRQPTLNEAVAELQDQGAPKSSSSSKAASTRSKTDASTEDESASNQAGRSSKTETNREEVAQPSRDAASRSDRGDRSERERGEGDRGSTRESRSAQSNQPQRGASSSGSSGSSRQSATRDQKDTRDNKDSRDQRDSKDSSRDHSGHDQSDSNGDDEDQANRRRSRRGRNRDRSGQDDQTPQEPVEVAGLLDLRDEGYGFLRVNGFLPTREDVYVSVKQTRQFALRKGDFIIGASRAATRNERNPALMRIDSINGVAIDDVVARPRFEELTPLFPDEPLKLESRDDPYNMTTRIIDMVAPIGKGQRGMIVAPPKAGKTTVMKEIARAIETNNPEVHLIVLLIDERPEEVTDMRRWLKTGEVAASTFDRPAEEHVQVIELALERAKRMVEVGQDVVIMLDGITRLARAYNLTATPTGRLMSGGLDAAALYPPKKIFGAARNVEEGGSLTILATALVETGSRMDEVIFEEFKGTGNLELKLDRDLAQRRVFPAIDIDASSTRHEELLIDRKALNQIWKLRRVLSALSAEGNPAAGMEMLIDRMKTFRSNEEFLEEVAKSATGM